MANSKYKSIWELLSTNNFKEEIPETFHCIICHNVTIEPYVASCGCRYCSKCIKEYINTERKTCPGEKSECMEDCLDIDVNVLRDIVSIRRISRLEIKCPNDLCDVKCTVNSMSDHMRICGMSSIKCPFETIGCDVGQMSGDNVKNHSDKEWFKHSQSLVEAIYSLRNDISALKKSLKKKDEQIDKLQNDANNKKRIIREITQQINDQRSELDALIYKDAAKEKELSRIKDEIRRMKETQKKTMVNVNNVEKNVVEMNCKGDIEKHEKRFNDLKDNQENIERKISSIIVKVSKSQIYDEREFLWRIDNFLKMKMNCGWRDVILWRYSIKLCFSIRCIEGHLGISFRIMKGELDGFLEWPIKYKMTMSLINQDTMAVHAFREYGCEENKINFKKPINVFNIYVGDNAFITIEDIEDSPGVVINDSLLISFIIDYQL